MKGRSEWNWLPPPDEGIWRHGAAWMRPFAVSAPWITLAILMGLMARVATARPPALLLLADRRVPSGDLMNLTGLARSAGVRHVQIAEKHD